MKQLKINLLECDESDFDFQNFEKIRQKLPFFIKQNGNAFIYGGEMLRKSKRLYLAITPDKYELPIAVFENIDEVCKFAKRSKDAIWGAISRKQVDRVNKCRYISIEIGRS